MKNFQKYNQQKNQFLQQGGVTTIVNGITTSLGNTTGGNVSNLPNGSNPNLNVPFLSIQGSSSGMVSQQQLNSMNSQVNSHVSGNQIHHGGNVGMGGNSNMNNMGGINVSGLNGIGNNMNSISSMSNMNPISMNIGAISNMNMNSMGVSSNLGSNISLSGNSSMANMSNMNGPNSISSHGGGSSHILGGHSVNSNFNSQIHHSNNLTIPNSGGITPSSQLHNQTHIANHRHPSHVHSASSQNVQMGHGSGGQGSGRDYIERQDNFAQLVNQIQFIHGDAEDPQKNTVRVIEQYVRQKLMKLLIKARENMFRRMGPNQSSYEITLDDIAFLIRHRIDKLTRFHTYLSIRKYDVKEKENRDFKVNIDTCLHRGDVDRLERILTLTEDQYSNQEMEKPPRNMFLIRENVDEKRASAAKQLVKDMILTEFNRYSKYGIAVFKFSQDPKKFREWLRVDEMNYNIHSDTLEALSYLAYELVALVTQTALLVKRNTELYREDMTSNTISVVTGVLDDAWKSNLSTVHLEGDMSYDVAPSTRRAIQPGHVFEAIRRLETKDFKFSKHYEFL